MLFAVLQFIALHTLDGRSVLINPPMIVSIVEARSEDNPKKLGTSKVNCTINMLDTKFVTVTESCDSVRQRLQQMKKE